jgi:hypothetical protein
MVVIAPTWLGRLAAPMRSFLRQHSPLQPGISTICVMAGSGAFEAEQDVANLAGKVPAPALGLLQRDVLSGAAADDIAAFAVTLGRREVARPTPSRPAWVSPRDA